VSARRTAATVLALGLVFGGAACSDADGDGNPEVEAPDVSAPDVSAPDVDAPDVDVQGGEAPDVDVNQNED
jgi:hypothetical protein